MARRGYGQFCPVAKATEIVGERWTLLVLRELLSGSQRFNDLRRGVPLMSPTLLSKRLVQLTDAGLVTRPPDDKQRYVLTEAGEAMRPIVEGLGTWAHRYVQHRIDPDDLDPALLMWDVRRCVRADRIPADRRTVVRFDLQEVSQGRRRWWLVFDRGDVDLCLRDPGHDVDLFVRGSLRTLTEVWMGHRTLRGALASDAIVLKGPRPQVRAFPDWFALGLFASAPRAPAA